MRLRTLGRLELIGSDFKQQKPLLLLAYLCLEGSQERRYLAELFWPGGADPLGNLATVLARLKKVEEALWETDGVRVCTAIPCDALNLLAALDKGAWQEAVELYQGRFLESFYLKEAGAELEEWVYAKRESIADRVRTAQLSVAEEAAAQDDFSAAAKLAERSYLLPGAAEPGEEELKRIYRLLLAGSSNLAEELRKEAQSFGISLSLTIEEAQQELANKAKRVPPHNLIPQPTPFVGRIAEIGALSKRLSDPHCRLLTIVGPGGIGKTRLAIEVAQAQLATFQGGVYFVSLVSVSSPSLMAYAVSDALNLSLLGQETPHLQLAQLLKDKTLLLVLDNLEHLLADLSLIHSLLAHAPKVKLLVTSREPLNFQAEHVFDLRGLPIPEGTVDIGAFDAVKLFVQNARQRRASFALDDTNTSAVSRICQLVGGMPLALELAASWLRVLSPEEIANELERGIDLLHANTRDLPARHHSIRAVFDHSWELLSAQEQAVLRRLAVFRGGFRREAATEVAGASLAILAGLVDKSLLRTAPDGRYRRHPLAIQYTQERLAEHPEEKAQAEERHGLYYLRLVQERGKNLKTLKRKESLAVLEQELANISAAWHWAVEHERVEELKQNAQAVTDIFLQRMQEALELFTLAVSRLSDTHPNHQAALGYILIEQSFNWIFLGHQDVSIEAVERGLALVRALKDDEGILRGLSRLSQSSWVAGDFRRSKLIGEEGLELARHLERADYIGTFLQGLALVLKEFDDLPNVGQFYEEGLAEIRQLQADPHDLAAYLHYYAFYLLHNGDLHHAQVLEREALRLFQQLGIRARQMGCLDALGVAAFKLGDVDKAEALLEEALAMANEGRVKFMQAYIRSNLAKVAIAKGDYARAEQYLKRSFQIGLDIKNTFDVATALVSLAELRIAQDEPLQAAPWLALAVHHPGAERHDRMEAQQVLAGLRDQLPPEALEAAISHGKDLKLEELVRELLVAL